jgi:type I restriction enzyme S subunit
VGEWPLVAIDDLVVDIIDRRGVTPIKLGSNFTAAGHRVISAKLVKGGAIDLAADEPRYVDERTYTRWMRSPLRADDVILTSEAPLGELAYLGSDVDWVLGQRLFALRSDKRRLHGRYLYYALQADPSRSDLLSRATGTTAQGIRQTELRRVRIPLPPLTEQRQIADILGALDDKVELNRRTSETLQAIARALFKSWFVDFDPVRAKAEGRDPGLPPHLVDLFPDHLVDSDLGEIPEGWGIAPLDTMAELQVGGDWGEDGPGTDRVAVRCLRGVDLDRIRRAGWSDAPTRFVSPRSIERRRPTDHDVLIEGSGECGRSLAFAGVPDLYAEPVAYSNFCKRVRCEGRGSAVYVEEHLNGLVRSGVMKTYVTGTAMPNLDINGLLKGYQLVLPTGPVRDAYADFVLRARARLYSPEARTLSEVRDGLLPRLLSGQLTP